MTAQAGMAGAAPTVSIGPAPSQSETVQPTTSAPPEPVAVEQAPESASAPMTEQQKYERMWQYDHYRIVSEGETVAQMFLEQARPKPGSTIIDFGTGTGRGAFNIGVFGNGQFKVHMLDFAANCLDEDVRNCLTSQPHVFQFTQHDLTKDIPIAAEYGFCTDVMEHIPTVDVNRVLANILKAAQHVFFSIATKDDVNGMKYLGAPLHLTVQPYSWWLAKFREMDCTIHWSVEEPNGCGFYVSAWQAPSEIVKTGELNTGMEEIRANVKANVAGPWEQVFPHPTNEVDVMLLAAGPSLNDYEAEIHKLRAEGVKLITLNGTYHWALARGLVPSAQIVVDAREFNKRFTHPVVDDCKYLIGSQVHPSVLEGLPVDRTLLWHTSAEDIKDILNDRYEVWHSIPGGSTVMLRAIPLLRMLGFRRFHIFGWDSCVVSEADHHAIPQPENDTELVINTLVAGRAFKCHIGHVSQAKEFQDLLRFMGDEVELEVYGNGLIAHMLKAGAELADAEVAEGITAELDGALAQAGVQARDSAA